MFFALRYLNYFFAGRYKTVPSINMQSEPPIDALEKKIRLGCGLVAGLVIGLLVGMSTFALVAGPLWTFAIVVAIVFALLALRFGDRFWSLLAEWLPWH